MACRVAAALLEARSEGQCPRALYAQYLNLLAAFHGCRLEVGEHPRAVQECEGAHLRVGLEPLVSSAFEVVGEDGGEFEEDLLAELVGAHGRFSP